MSFLRRSLTRTCVPRRDARWARDSSPKGMLDPALDHLVITASRGLEGEDCEGDQPPEARRVREHRALLFECPEGAGLHANHVLLRWSVDAVSAAVSVHGHTETNRELMEDIASGIEWIRPGA